MAWPCGQSCSSPSSLKWKQELSHACGQEPRPAWQTPTRYCTTVRAEGEDLACGAGVTWKHEVTVSSLHITFLTMLFTPVLISKGSNEMRGMDCIWQWFSSCWLWARHHLLASPRADVLLLVECVLFALHEKATGLLPSLSTSVCPANKRHICLSSNILCNFTILPKSRDFELWVD